MKTVEIKRISFVSVFKFFGSISLVWGLILGLFSEIIVNFMNIKALSGIPILSKLSGGLLEGILFGVFCGVSGGIVYAAIALIYNFFAAIVGGIKIDINE